MVLRNRLYTGRLHIMPGGGGGGGGAKLSREHSLVVCLAGVDGTDNRVQRTMKYRIVHYEQMREEHGAFMFLLESIGGLLSCGGNPQYQPEHPERHLQEDDVSSFRAMRYKYTQVDSGDGSYFVGLGGIVFLLRCSTKFDADEGARWGAVEALDTRAGRGRSGRCGGRGAAAADSASASARSDARDWRIIIGHGIRTSAQVPKLERKGQQRQQRRRWRRTRAKRSGVAAVCAATQNNTNDDDDSASSVLNYSGCRHPPTFCDNKFNTATSHQPPHTTPASSRTAFPLQQQRGEPNHALQRLHTGALGCSRRPEVPNTAAPQEAATRRRFSKFAAK